MRIFSTSAVKIVDALTVQYEPITPFELMERASCVLVRAVVEFFPVCRHFAIFAGTGNNGGDGLVMARLLIEKGCMVDVYMYDSSARLSACCADAYEKLIEERDIIIHNISSEGFPVLSDDIVIIDALFGSGLSRPLEGQYASIVRDINLSPCKVAAVDVPSGLMGEENAHANEQNVVCADVTFTLQFPKLAMLFADNERFVGRLRVLDIGLSKRAMNETEPIVCTIEREDLLPLLTARRRHSHKGDYGRALLVAGSLGMAGASVLAARAAMRSGVGLLTLHVPRCNNTIVQTTLPEAMTSLDICDTHITSLPSVGRFNAVAVGPGLGTDESTAVALLQLMDCNVPVVMDADALNILSMHPDWFYKIPAGSVITPHPGEFARLTGCATGGYEALQRARDFAERYKVCVVLKGAYTAVISPNGDCSFNHCGNAGMATGGSGDVLTGILLALLAQGHTAYDAARLAVYIHGKAGNEAAAAKGMRSMIAGDIVEALPSAWLSLEKDLQYWNSDF